MSCSLHNRYSEYLTSDDLTLDGVQQLLGPDIKCDENIDFLHECPLLLVLQNKKCSVDIVTLLLQGNSSIYCRDLPGHNCLYYAIRCSRDEAIVKALLEKGAQILYNVKRMTDTSRAQSFKPSDFCRAMNFGASKSVLKLLLEAEANPNITAQINLTCEHCYRYPLYCFLACGKKDLFPLTEDFLNLLLSKGGDLNSVETTESAVCIAIQGLKGPQTIELLLQKGASLDSCKLHESPMLCATDRAAGRVSTVVFQFLLNKNAAMDVRNPSGLTPLQCLLLKCVFDFNAVKLMVNHPSFDANIVHEWGNLLHMAVCSYSCQIKVLQLLIDKGVPVNERNKAGLTPMEKAFLKDKDYHVLKFIFAAGGSADLSKNLGNISVLEYALKEYETEPFALKPRYLKIIELLLKCSCLENLDYGIESLIPNYSKHSYFFRFVDECEAEKQRMDLMELGDNGTLLDFVIQHNYPQNLARDPDSRMVNYDLNQMLSILSGNVFAIYFEIIVAKIGRKTMEAKLEEVAVYTFKNYVGSSKKRKRPASFCDGSEKRIVLNYVCDLNISKYLSDDEFMNWILAYFNH